MDMRLLNYYDKKLTPEARWLLLQWSQQMGLEKPLTLPLRDLRVCFEVPLLKLRQALACLTEQGMVAAEIYKCGQKKGRPRTHFTCTVNLHHELAKIRVPDVTSHHTAIEHLFSSSTAPPMPGHDEHPNLLLGQSRIQHLPVATRWLLIVLLAHADVTGSLTHLSYRALQRLTGLNRVRLRSQLRKLSDMGVLADYQGARLGKALGVKRTSIIVLNLAHPALGGSENKSVDVLFFKQYGARASSTEHDMVDALFVSAILEDENQQAEHLENNNAPITEPEQLATRARHKDIDRKDEVHKDAGMLLPSKKYIAPVAAQLAGCYQKAGTRWLQAYVQHYAMKLLNDEWVTLADDQGLPESPVADVMQAIEQDCQVAQPSITETVCRIEQDDTSVKEADDDDSEGESLNDGATTAPEPLPVLLYAMAHHLARQLRFGLLNVLKLDADAGSDATFCLIPVTLMPDQAKYYGRYQWQLRCYFVSDPPDKDFVLNVVTVWTHMGNWLRGYKESQLKAAKQTSSDDNATP